MLFEFFGLAAALITALLLWQRRERWRHAAAEALRLSEEAITPTDFTRVAAAWATSLALGPPPVEAQAVRIAWAAALDATGDHQRALAELDQVELKLLGPETLALWLNNRAYVLGQLGRCDEALDNLGDAEELLADSADSAGGPRRGSVRIHRRILESCVQGTRGIVHYMAGDLDGGERCLRRAIAMDESLEPATSGFIGREARRLLAERCFWLARIAAARGDHATKRQQLALAAEQEHTPFGERARRELAGAPPLYADRGVVRAEGAEG